MNTERQVHPSPLCRCMDLFIGQPTAAQVEPRRASADLQFQPMEGAVRLGWAGHPVKRMGQDRAPSGQTVASRSGSTRTTVESARGHVGLIGASGSRKPGLHSTPTWPRSSRRPWQDKVWLCSEGQNEDGPQNGRSLGKASGGSGWRSLAKPRIDTGASWTGEVCLGMLVSAGETEAVPARVRFPRDSRPGRRRTIEGEPKRSPLPFPIGRFGGASRAPHAFRNSRRFGGLSPLGRERCATTGKMSRQATRRPCCVLSRMGRFCSFVSSVYIGRFNGRLRRGLKGTRGNEVGTHRAVRGGRP
jgi:hypothetical protein